MLTVARIINVLEAFAPPELAASWDNVGLLLGDRSNKVRRVLTCLTVTPEVAAEAVEDKAQLIITHHPILFRPVKRLTADHPARSAQGGRATPVHVVTASKSRKQANVDLA